MKATRQESSGIPPLKSKEGFIKSDNQAKAEILNTQFKSAFTKEDTTNIPSKGDSPYPAMKSINVSVKGVLKLLRNLNIHKASGPDDIPTFILKVAAEELAPILTVFFQMSLDAGEVPEEWRDARVVPIFKKGEKHLPQNYRPVSLTSVMCKLLEHIVHSNIMGHLDQHKILHDAQHGFRKRRSCESQLLITIHKIARKLSKTAQVDVILLDFAKAFDKVPHQRLLHKLQYYGIRGPALNWIASFLKERKQKVVVEGSTSTVGEVTSGVPQGTVLGPLLFLAYINDLPDDVNSAEVRLFADDCFLFKEITTQEDAASLQKDLTSLQRWEEKWQMAFNPTKCSVIRIRSSKRQKILTFPYQLHGHQLSTEQHSKYLGVTFSDDLSWSEHVNTVAAKGNRTLGFLRRNFWKCPVPVKSSMYVTLLRPILEYAAPVWSPSTQKDIKTLEKVQRAAVRFISGEYRDRSPGTVTRLLEVHQLQTLEQRRQEASLSIIYRTIYQLVDIEASSVFTLNTGRTRGTNKITQQRPSTTQEGNSFFPRMTPYWNRLPEEVRASQSLEEFQRQIGRLP